VVIGSRGADADDGAAEFAQAKVIRHARNEATVHRHGQQYGVRGGESGAVEGKLFIARQPFQIGFGELPDQRAAGRTAGGEDVHDLLARHTEKFFIVFGNNRLVNRRDSGNFSQRNLIPRRQAGAGKMFAVKRRAVKGMAEGFRPGRLLQGFDVGG